MKLKPFLLLSSVLAVALFFPVVEAFAQFTVEGVVLEADGKARVPDNAVTVGVTVFSANGNFKTFDSTAVANGEYKVVFPAAANIAAGDIAAVRAFKLNDFNTFYSDITRVTLTDSDIQKKSVKIPDLITNRVSIFTISGTVFNIIRGGVFDAKVSVKGKEATTRADGSYEVILTDFATNPVVGETVTITVEVKRQRTGDIDKRTYTATVTEAKRLLRDIAFFPEKTAIGGLSVNTQRYLDLINVTISEAFKSVTDPIIKQPAVQRKLIDQLLVPQIKTFLPLYPQAPRVIQPVEGVISEGFGNAILPALSGVANPAGLLTDQVFAPAKAVGNKLDLFIFVPKAGATNVELDLVGPGTVGKPTIKQVTEASKEAPAYEFQLEEEIALLLLPSYPGLGGTDPQPVFAKVNLMLSSDSRPLSKRSDYQAIPMSVKIIDGKPVWTATAKVEGGKSHFYFYELNLKNPINLYGTAFRTSQTRFIIPDPRNLQLEDRGLIERLAPAIGQVINGIDLEKVNTDPDSVIRDLVPKLTTALNLKVQEILAEAIANLDPMVVSRFTAPIIPASAEGSLWMAHFDLKGAADGEYELKGKIAGLEESISKKINVDRSAATSGSLTVSKARDSSLYQKPDGSYMAYGKSAVATVRLTAKFDKSDAIGAVFQVMEFAEDPVEQARKVWFPVNASATLAVALGRILFPELDKELSQYPTLQSLINLTHNLDELRRKDPQKFASALAQLDPRLDKALGDRIKGLDAANKKRLDNVIALANQFAANPGDPAPLIALANLDNFNLLQAFAGLEKEASLLPGFGGTAGSTEALIPIIGKYWVRAVPVDDVLNLETVVKPTLIEVVPAEIDKAEVIRASVGDRNGDGDDEDADFAESGPADGFTIYSDDTQVKLTAKITTRTRHPLVPVVFQYAGADKKWIDIGAGKEQADGTWTVDWKIDFPALSAKGKELKVRAVATNALVSDPAPKEATMPLDPGIRPIPPLVVSFRIVAESFNEDSGAPKGTIKLEAFTAARTAPEADRVVFQISTDGGKTWSDLTPDKGGAAGGAVLAKDAEEVKADTDQGALQAAIEEVALGRAKEASTTKSFKRWRLNWDSAKVPDTITKDEPAATDFTKDDNPYQLRALTAYEIDRKLTPDPRLVKKTSTDNIDDVPPIGTKLLQVIAEGQDVKPQADGSFKVSGTITFIIEPPVDPKTFEKVLLKFDRLIPTTEAKLEGGKYTATLDTVDKEGNRIYPNGKYTVQVLAVDKAKNEEKSTSDNTKPLVLANPEIPVIGDLTTLVQNRPLQRVAEVKTIYVAGTSSFKFKAVNFKDIDLLYSAKSLADVTLNSPSIGKGNIKITVVGEEVSIDWNTILWQESAGLPDGTYYVGLKLTGSVVLDKILRPIVVDNTPPTLTVVAPVEGHNVSIRPSIWITYSDATAGIDETKNVELELIQPDRKPFDKAKISKDNRKDESIYSLIPSESLPVGSYIAKFKVTDRSGNSVAAERRFVTEADLPTVTILSPLPGETVGVRPTISAVYSGPLAIDTAKLKFVLAAPGAKVIDIAGKKVLGTEVSLVPGEDVTKVKFTLKEPEVPGRKLLDTEISFTPPQDLAEGEYTATIEVIDVSGASVKASRFFIVKTPPPPPKDTVKPTIVFLSPRADAPVSSKPTILVTYSDADSGIDVKSVELKLDGVVVKADADAGRAAFTPTTSLKGGAHQAVLTVADLAGNKATATWGFTVEANPPQVIVVSPQGGSTVGTKPTISASYIDDLSDIDLNSIKVSLDGADVAADKTKTQVSHTPTADLKPGSHSVKVEVADQAGNLASLSWSFFVEVDTTLPQITVVSPTGTVIEPRPKVSASFSDEGSGVASVKLAVDEGAGGEKSATAAEISAGLIDFVPTADLKPGVHSVGISVTDKAGNTGQARWSFTIAVDKTPPSISIVSPQGGSLLGSRKVTITAGFTDDLSGVDAVALSLDGKDTGAKPAGAPLESVNHTADNLSVGDHTVALRVTDKSGNTAVAQWNFSIESIPPVVSIVSPQAESKNTDKRVVISANYADNLAGVDGASIKLVVDKEDVSAKPTTTKSSTQIIYNPDKDFEVGRHSVRLEVSDKVGNKTVQDWSFVVEEVFGGIVDAHNFPNPFNGATKIAFILPRSAEVTIRIFDFTGRLVRELLKSNEEAGRKAIDWDGKTETGDDLANGVYFAQIIVKSDFETKSAIVKLALSRK